MRSRYNISIAFIIFLDRDNFAKQMLSSSSSVKNNRKGSTRITTRVMDGNVMTTGGGGSINCSPKLSTCEEERLIPLTIKNQIHVS